MKAAAPFADGCAVLDRLLTGSGRSEIVLHAAKARTMGDALRRLRRGMRADAWTVGGNRLDLGPIVRAFDTATRRDGFHVLHDWDGKADHVNDLTIPIDVLDYVVRVRGDDEANPVVLSIALDYYFLNLLALFSLRVWDGDDADARLDVLSGLLERLQGADGSGQRFVDDAGTLILIATAHFEAVEIGYARLLARVQSLSDAHRLEIAVGHASSMGCHLRFGFEATYARDTMVMRDDNIADYPWLCFALLTLVREYDRAPGSGDRSRVVESILNGLSGDARAFVGEAPPSLAARSADQRELRERVLARRRELVAAFQPYRPEGDRYSPLAFFFNFSHNVLKGTVVDALLHAAPWRVSFNDLLSGIARDAGDDEARRLLAATLMGYARENPDRIRGRLMPVIVYDAQAGRRAFNVTLEKLTQ